MVLMLEIAAGLAGAFLLFLFSVWFFTLPRVELWLGIGDTAYKLRCGRGSELGDLVPQPPPPTGPIHWPDVTHFRKAEHGPQAQRPPHVGRASLFIDRERVIVNWPDAPPRAGYIRGTLK